MLFFEHGKDIYSELGYSLFEESIATGLVKAKITLGPLDYIGAHGLLAKIVSCW